MKKLILSLSFIAFVTAIYAQNPRVTLLGDRRTELYSHMSGNDSVRFTIVGKVDTMKTEWFAVNGKPRATIFGDSALIYTTWGTISERRYGASNLTFWKNEDFSRPYQYPKYVSNYFRDNRLYAGYVNNGWSGFELGVFTGDGNDGSNQGHGMIPSITGGVLNLGVEYYPRPQLFVPKLGAHFIFLFCEVGIEAAYNTQFKGSYLWSLKPKIGVTFLGCYTLSYNYSSYQKQINNPVYDLMNRHGLSFIVRKQRKGKEMKLFYFF